MDTIGPSELLIILLVLVAIFGAGRLPKMARSLGEGIREFRTALRDASSPAEGDSDIANRGPAPAAATELPGSDGDPRRSAP